MLSGSLSLNLSKYIRCDFNFYAKNAYDASAPDAENYKRKKEVGKYNFELDMSHEICRYNISFLEVTDAHRY